MVVCSCLLLCFLVCYIFTYLIVRDLRLSSCYELLLELCDLLKLWCRPIFGGLCCWTLGLVWFVIFVFAMSFCVDLLVTIWFCGYFCFTLFYFIWCWFWLFCFCICLYLDVGFDDCWFLVCTIIGLCLLFEFGTLVTLLFLVLLDALSLYGSYLIIFNLFCLCCILLIYSLLVLRSVCVALSCVSLFWCVWGCMVDFVCFLLDLYGLFGVW